MRELSIYRTLAAYGLLLVLALPLGVQGVHPLLDEHEPQAHCDSDLGQIHIHDQSYAFDHCFVCTFHFSHYTEFLSPSLAHIPGWVLGNLMISGHQIPVKTTISNHSSRAPPTA